MPKITHMLSFQQFYTQFIPVATTTGHHWVNTAVIPAGENRHRDTGIRCPLQLPANLGNLFVSSRSKKYFRNERLISICFLLCVTSIFTSFFSRGTGTLRARDGKL